MLFLTTNRVSRFDKAFVSRIHLALNYPDLSTSQRSQIWVNALDRFERASLDSQLIDVVKGRSVDRTFEDLAAVDINGRVISYAVKTAKALADAEGARLGIGHLAEVVKIYQRFSGDMENEQVA